MNALGRRRRRLDRAAYRLLGRLYRRLYPSDAPPGRIGTSRIRRLLVVRDDAIGDMAVTLPALTYLHETLPHAEIDVLASPRNAALLDGDPRVHRVYVAGSDRARRALASTLRERRYDVIVSPIMRGGLREGRFAASIAHRDTARVSPWRQTQYLGLFTHLVRIPLGQRHMATRMLALVQRAIGDGPAPAVADIATFPPALVHDADADARAAEFVRGLNGFVALNAWAAEPHRCFGVKLTAILTNALSSCVVVLTPPPGRESEAYAIAAATNAMVAPPGTLHDLVALLRRADACITPDTANVHLASAIGRPVLSVHTPIGADVRDWGPWGVPSATVVLRDPRPLSETPPEDILAAFDALRAELASGPRYVWEARRAESR